MKNSEDRTPPFTLVKSSSRDNKVSCETLSHVDWYSMPKFEGREHFLYGADDIYWDADDPDLDLDAGLQHARDAHNRVGKSFPAANLFGCFPKSSAHLQPRTIMSPGREGKRGAGDNVGRPRTHPSPIPHSGGIPHSGAIPHSGPLKLNTGPIISHSGTLKGPAKGFSWPSIIPADIMGKKKPPGYDEEEPTSPEVTCLGTVRMKHKCRRDSPIGGDKRQLCEWSKFFKKKTSQSNTEKEAKRRGGKGQVKTAESQGDFEVKSGSSYPVESKETAGTRGGTFSETERDRGDRGAMFSDYVNQIAGEKGGIGAADEKEAGAEYVPQVPPPNSLLLMRGSRNLERENQKPGFSDAPEIPTITKGSSVRRQVSLPKPPPESSLWKRRNACQPTALDTRTPIRLEIKEPCTK